MEGSGFMLSFTANVLETIAGEYGVLIITAPALVVIALIIFISPLRM